MRSKRTIPSEKPISVSCINPIDGGSLPSLYAFGDFLGFFRPGGSVKRKALRRFLGKGLAWCGCAFFIPEFDGASRKERHGLTPPDVRGDAHSQKLSCGIYALFNHLFGKNHL